MIPSDIKPIDSFAPSQNSWRSKDKKTVIHVARGGADLTDEMLNNRLNEYYKQFCKDTSHFECKKVSQRVINRKIYGEIQYFSHVAGYYFYNVFLLGSYREKELIITIQCTENRQTENKQMFENVSGSIRIFEKIKSS